MNQLSIVLSKVVSIFAIAILMTTLLQSCKKDDVASNPLTSDKYQEFDNAMQKLWADHMQYTYLTVDAFFNNNTALDANLTRLLKNQEDIGAAIVDFYGQVAGDQLTVLLKGHINGAVPVLTAAKNGDQAALEVAIADWRVNAKEIADFLSAANPTHWEQQHMRMHMDDHISKTIVYSVDLLQKDYPKATADYDAAFEDMMHFATSLSEGIAKQFPDKF